MTVNPPCSSRESSFIIVTIAFLFMLLLYENLMILSCSMTRGPLYLTDMTPNCGVQAMAMTKSYKSVTLPGVLKI